MVPSLVGWPDGEWPGGKSVNCPWPGDAWVSASSGHPSVCSARKSHRNDTPIRVKGEVKQGGKPAGDAPVLTLMGRVSMLCNDAELFQEEGVWGVEGDPTEGTLYPFATKLGLERQAEQVASPRIDAIPFESEHKFMATLHDSADGTEVLLVKGAPEVILEHCYRQQIADGQPAPLDRAHFMQASDRLAAQGERVLALDPALRVGIQVRAARRQRERFNPT